MTLAVAETVFKPAADVGAPAQIARLARQLAEYRERLAIDPQHNPVKQLAFDLSRAIERGDVAWSHLVETARELCDRALIARAAAMRAYVGEVAPEARDAELAAIVEATAWRDGELRDFAAFAADWSRPTDGVVFTGHPTFAMSAEMRAVLVGLIDGRVTEPDAHRLLGGLTHAPDMTLSLASEHAQAQDAIGHAQGAVARVARVVADVARRLYPADWQRLAANPVELNSWVGYDLDGRTDISWHDSLVYRLSEKRAQLARYLAAAERLPPHAAAHTALVAPLRQAIGELGDTMALFATAPDEPAALSLAANHLTARSGTPLHASLDTLADETAALAASEADPAIAAQAAALATAMRAHGLGSARVHLRINAMQVHNALRKHLGSEDDLFGRQTLRQLDGMIAAMQPHSVNFSSAAIERATAIRQFILIAQILKHVDGSAPIRLLIAECEQPATVLGALYFARAFGVDDKVDISPLFETPFALDQGARIIETLLRCDAYRAYLARRGRIAIQTGFSDAGRFMGQIPAALAVERLHGQIAEVLTRVGLGGIDVLIFDTHGESMGRGAHPSSLADRFDYVLSPWVRQRFWDKGLRLTHETSFQGGDGYVLFGSETLAYAVLVELIKWRRTPARTHGDAFYSDRDFTRDLFESAKTYQTRMFNNPDYRAALAAFGTNLLPKTGSRKSERQFDAGTTDGRAIAAAMRAIPNNAILQQLGYPLNVVSGIGWVLRRDAERFADIYARSDRMRRLIRLVAHAKQLSSIKTLVAYSSVFDDAFWVTRPLNGMERDIKEPCLYLAGLLRGDGRRDAMMHLATLLREDAVYLHDLLRQVGVDTRWTATDHARVELDVLHAIRIAMIQRIFLLAARIPPFSTRNDVSRADILRLVMSLRIDEAMRLLNDSFPIGSAEPSYYCMDETASYTGASGSDYAVLHERYFAPIRSAYQVVKEISVGISHHYRAHG